MEFARAPRAMFSGTLGEWEEGKAVYQMSLKSAMLDDFCASTRDPVTMSARDHRAAIRHDELVTILRSIEAQIAIIRRIEVKP